MHHINRPYELSKCEPEPRCLLEGTGFVNGCLVVFGSDRIIGVGTVHPIIATFEPERSTPIASDIVVPAIANSRNPAAGNNARPPTR